MPCVWRWLGNLQGGIEVLWASKCGLPPATTTSPSSRPCYDFLRFSFIRSLLERCLSAFVNFHTPRNIPETGDVSLDLSFSCIRLAQSQQTMEPDPTPSGHAHVRALSVSPHFLTRRVSALTAPSIRHTGLTRPAQAFKCRPGILHSTPEPEPCPPSGRRSRRFPSSTLPAPSTRCLDLCLRPTAVLASLRTTS